MRFLSNSSAISTLALVAMMSILAGCGGGGDSDSTPSAEIKPAAPADADASGDDFHFTGEVTGPVELTTEMSITESPANPPFSLHPKVIIKTSHGDIHLRLDAEKAPRTVANFLEDYVDRGFYSDTLIHFVEKGYMIAGGGYTKNNEEKETLTPIRSEADNGLSNRRGTIAMTRYPDFVHSATSQFYINLSDNTDLDYVEDAEGNLNGYCVFGEVIAGMDVVDKIANVPVSSDELRMPVAPVLIKSIERIPE